MGKGDKRTRRGKISAGSYGKTRQKYKAPAFVATEKAPAAAEKPAPKKRVAKRVAAAAPAEAPQTAPPAPEETAPVGETPEAPAAPEGSPAAEEPQSESDTAQA